MLTECRNCGASFPVKNPAIVGQVKPCPKCGKKFRVELLDDDFDDIGEELPQRSASSSRSSKKKSSSRSKQGASSGPNLLPWIIGGVTFVVFAVGGFFLVRAFTNKVTEVVAETTVAVSDDKTKQSLHDLAIAMHNYHDNHNRLPSPGKSHDGKAGLSWRVHLLPYIEQAPLYNEFHLDEPWDSPHNLTLLDRMPKLYTSPDVTQAGFTTFRLVAGQASGSNSQQQPVVTAFTAEEGSRFRDLSDGMTNIVLVVSSGPSTAVEWTKPETIPFNETNPLAEFGSPAGKSFYVVAGDGRVHSIRPDADPAIVARLLLCNDGNPVNFADVQ
ncbi:MAG: DUF1559 domain-containing protein [Planctomycetaceae bacterium]